MAKIYWLGIILCSLGGEAIAMAQELKTNGWELVTEHAAFSPRDTAEGVVFRDWMWLSNAYHSGGVLVRDLWKSADGKIWEKVLEPTPYDGYSEMIVFQDKMWAIKGSVWNSADGEHWQCVLDKTPFGVIGYGECVVFQEAMWQLGGPGIWRSEDGVRWECVQPNPPFGSRFGAAIAVFDNKLWLCGGATPKASEPPEKHYPQYTTYNDVWSSPDGIHWTRVTEQAPWAPRMWTVACAYAGRLWLLGGFSNRESKNFAEAWHTRDGIHWTALSSEKMWAPRHEPTVYVFQGSLWLVAGNAWPLMNDVWKLTVEPLAP